MVLLGIGLTLKLVMLKSITDVSEIQRCSLELENIMSARFKIKLAEFMQRENITPYKLREQSELSTMTVYQRLLTGHDGVKLETLAKAISALEVLLERRIELSEVLELEWID
jgi:hypothetical protein